MQQVEDFIEGVEFNESTFYLFQFTIYSFLNMINLSSPFLFCFLQQAFAEDKESDVNICSKNKWIII